MPAGCSYEGCPRAHLAKGLCSTHYSQRWRGVPLRPLKRPNGSSLIRDNLGRKFCTRCERWEPVSAFTALRNATTADGLMAFCRECCRLRKYGMTRDQYEALLTSQGGRCAVPGCNYADELVVDHDHSCCSGWKSCGSCVRGIVCRLCNTRLGTYEKRKDAFEEYLNLYQGKSRSAIGV